MKKYAHAFIILLCITSLVRGQDQLAAANMKDLYGRKIPRALLQTVSVNFHNTPLENALTTISEQSNVKLNYNREKLPLQEPITLQMENVYAIEALLSIFKKTGTQIFFSSEGQL